jgi:hypothetical protein
MARRTNREGNMADQQETQRAHSSKGASAHPVFLQRIKIQEKGDSRNWLERECISGIAVQSKRV